MVPGLGAQWLQCYLELNLSDLPGKWECSTARQDFERYRTVSKAQAKVRMKLEDRFPNGMIRIPTGNLPTQGISTDTDSSLRGKEIKHADMHVAFGFGRTAWFELLRRWNREDHSGGIGGAATFIAWTRDPDAADLETSSLNIYQALNRLPFSMLKAAVSADRSGCLVGWLRQHGKRTGWKE